MDSVVNNAKNVVSIVRDGLITAILILLLVAPQHMKKSLADAGFVKGNIAGFNWEATVQDNNAQLTQATKSISTLQEQLTKTESALKESEDARKALAAQAAKTTPGSSANYTERTRPALPTNQIFQENSQALEDAAAGKTKLQERIKANVTLLATVKHAGQ